VDARPTRPHLSTPVIVRLLAVLVAADLVVAGVTRFANLHKVVASEDGRWVDYVSALGALLVPPLLLACWWGYRHLTAAAAAAAMARTEGDGLRAFTATSHDWLWHADTDLVFTFSSPAVADVLGYQPGEVVGRSMLDLVHPDDAATVLASTGRANGSGDGWRDIELRWRHRDGHDVALQGSGTPVRDEAGTLVGFSGARRPAPVGEQHRRDTVAARRRVQQILDDGDLRIALQPIVDLNRNRWVAAEALARFPDGRGPDQWFADAHTAGLSVDLELLALRAALDLLPDLPPDVTLAINASPTLILEPRLPTTLAALGPDLARITLEITEHAAVTAYDEIRDMLAPLRERGMRLAVDDTGAGYASFSHVLSLRPDDIKLDRSLVAGIDSDAARRAFVTAIVLLALELGAAVTGEGVETPGELATLNTLGVDRAQGYHLARPTLSPATWGSWQQRRWLTPHGAGSSVGITAERSGPRP
jgi:PAS domain S-box-containing protein